MPTLTDSRSSVNSQQTNNRWAYRQTTNGDWPALEANKQSSQVIARHSDSIFDSDFIMDFTRVESHFFWWQKWDFYEILNNTLSGNFSLSALFFSPSLVVKWVSSFVSFSFGARCAMENDERNGVWMECEYACTCVYRLHAPILVFISLRIFARRERQPWKRCSEITTENLNVSLCAQCSPHGVDFNEHETQCDTHSRRAQIIVKAHSITAFLIHFLCAH